MACLSHLPGTWAREDPPKRLGRTAKNNTPRSHSRSLLHYVINPPDVTEQNNTDSHSSPSSPDRTNCHLLLTTSSTEVEGPRSIAHAYYTSGWTDLERSGGLFIFGSACSDIFIHKIIYLSVCFLFGCPFPPPCISSIPYRNERAHIPSCQRQQQQQMFTVKLTKSLSKPEDRTNAERSQSFALGSS